MRIGLREIIFIVLLLAIPVASFFFYFAPTNRQVAQAREEVRQKEVKLRQLEAYAGEAGSLDAEIARLKDAVAVFEHKVPSRREVDVVLKEVWELTARHHLVPKSIRTDRPVAAAQYSELPIHIAITGDFDGFYGFLLDLEKLRRITRMPHLTLKRVAGSDGQVEADLILSVFYDSDDGDGRDNL